MAGRRGRVLQGGWRGSARGPVGQVFLLVDALQRRRPPSFSWTWAESNFSQSVKFSRAQNTTPNSDFGWHGDRRFRRSSDCNKQTHTMFSCMMLARPKGLEGSRMNCSVDAAQFPVLYMSRWRI